MALYIFARNVVPTVIFENICFIFKIQNTYSLIFAVIRDERYGNTKASAEQLIRSPDQFDFFITNT